MKNKLSSLSFYLSQAIPATFNVNLNLKYWKYFGNLYVIWISEIFCLVKSTTFNSFGFGNGISIKCRERFSTSVEQVTTAQNDATYPRSPCLETLNNAAHLDSSCRERPSTSDELVTTAQNGATYPRSPPREAVRNAVHLDSSCRERLSTCVEQVTSGLPSLIALRVMN